MRLKFLRASFGESCLSGRVRRIWTTATVLKPKATLCHFSVEVVPTCANILANWQTKSANSNLDLQEFAGEMVCNEHDEPIHLWIVEHFCLSCWFKNLVSWIVGSWHIMTVHDHDHDSKFKIHCWSVVWSTSFGCSFFCGAFHIQPGLSFVSTHRKFGSNLGIRTDKCWPLAPGACRSGHELEHM